MTTRETAMILGCNDTTLRAADLDRRLQIAKAELLATHAQPVPSNDAGVRRSHVRALFLALGAILTPARTRPSAS